MILKNQTFWSENRFRETEQNYWRA